MHARTPLPASAPLSWVLLISPEQQTSVPTDPAELGQLLEGDELPLILGWTKGHCCCHRHRWNSTLRAESSCVDRGSIRLSGQTPSSTLASRWGLLGAWTGLCHPPEGPWVVCTDSKKKTFPTLPDDTMAERKTLAALHPPRTHADTQSLAMVPEFIEGGLRRKSCGAQTLSFPKRP